MPNKRLDKDGNVVVDQSKPCPTCTHIRDNFETETKSVHNPDSSETETVDGPDTTEVLDNE